MDEYRGYSPGEKNDNFVLKSPSETLTKAHFKLESNNKFISSRMSNTENNSAFKLTIQERSPNKPNHHNNINNYVTNSPKFFKNKFLQ